MSLGTEAFIFIFIWHYMWKNWLLDNQISTLHYFLRKFLHIFAFSQELPFLQYRAAKALDDSTKAALAYYKACSCNLELYF